MPMRLSGLASNMDTDAIIKELMKAQGLKKTKVENKLTKLEWKKDIWKDMNSKIYKFYTGPLSKLKTQGSFSTKKATSSNESKVTVKAGTGASIGSYQIEVERLASAQYVTSKKLDSTLTFDGGNKLPDIDVKGNTTLKDLGFDIEVGKENVIEFKGTTTANLYVTEKTTLNDFVQAAKNAGLNASYDETQKRLFLSGKESGKENTFGVTIKTVEITSGRSNLRDILGYSSTNGSTRIEMDKAIDEYLEYKDNTIAPGSAEDMIYQAAFKKLKNYMGDKLTSDLSAFYYKEGTNPDDTTLTLGGFYTNSTYQDIFKDVTLQDLLNQANENVTDDKEKILSAGDAAKKAEEKVETDLAGKVSLEELEEAKKKAREAAIEAERNKFVKFYQKQQKALIPQYPETVPAELEDSPYYKALDGVFGVNGLLTKVSKAEEFKETSDKINDNGLNRLGIGAITKNDDGSITHGNDVEVVASQDSKVVYNGATLEGSTNVITVNGVTLELHGETKGETVSLTVSNDIDGVYDMVRNFVKGYNELLQEMNKLYNADSARGFNPLTDDEKDSMTDKQIEKWEQKIKDSLLRRDDNLSGMLSSMRSNMAGSVTVNGKSLSLSSFGIVTGHYTEKGLLHLAGDSEDPIYGGQEDKLKKALEENPEDVMKVLNKLADNLYQDMTSKMKGTSLRSALTAYNDKEMDKLEKSYKKDIATLEKKLKEMENRYYKQFSAMESAMSKLNSQSSQLAGMLGM